MIRTFFRLERAGERDYARRVRALRNAAVIGIAILAIASAAALAVASGGGSAGGDSGQGQYGTKPDCPPYAAKGAPKANGRWQGCPEVYGSRQNRR